MTSAPPVATRHPSDITPLVPGLAARILELARREDWRAGHRLTEQALCEAFGVSRSPVRKALQALESAGAVVSSPNRGFQLAVAGDALAQVSVASPGFALDELYMRIAHDHIGGAQEHEVTEASLMVRYGLARHQVQRLLNALARDGLVERKAGRGWVFRRMLASVESHRESYRFRMMIEPAAILEPGYAVDQAELERCRREQRELLDGGIERCTPAQLFQAGSHFHETVIAGCGNRLVLDALRNINRMRRIVEYGVRLDRGRLHRQCEEHLQLIDLLARGERMEASQLMRQHLNTARITKVGDAD